MTDQAETPERADDQAPLPPPRQRTWPTMLLGAVILLCGIVIGAGATVLWFKDREPRRTFGKPPGSTAMAQHVQKVCDLTEEQTQKVEEIFGKHLREMMAMRHELQPKMASLHEQLRTDMKEVLTPEQFEKWHARFEAARKRATRMSPGGPGTFPRLQERFRQRRGHD